MARRSLRAAAQPIDTWSSCIAEDGIESTEAGTASRLSSATIAGLRVLGDHVPGVDARVVGEERRQALPSARRRGTGRCAARRSTPGRRRRSRGSPARTPSGAPWKLPLLSTRPSGSTTGLSMAAASSRAATVSACATVSRTAPCTCGEQRSEYASCTRVHSGLRWLAMIAEPVQEDPQVGRAARLAGMRAQRLQVGGEHGVGAQQRLDAHRRRDVGGARAAARRSCAASTSMPSIPSVPLISARPSFSASVTGVIPAAASASAAGQQHAVGVADLALADRGQRARGERGEVARAAQRAVLRHHRGDPGREQGGVDARRLGPHPGPAGGQRRQAQQLQRPHDLALHLGPGARGVRAHQRALQLGPLRERDVPGGQRAEPGGDAVVRRRVVGERLDHLPADLQLVLGLVGQRDGGAFPGDGDDLGGGEGGGADAHDGFRHALHRTPAAARAPWRRARSCPGSRTNTLAWAGWRNR